MLLNKKFVKVIGEFVKDYQAMLTGSRIAKKNNLNQKSVANMLNQLEKDGFLKSKVSGRNKQFYLNIDNKETINFISAIENLRTVNFYKKNPLIKEIASKIIFHCNGIVMIFGSYAIGKQKEDSDLDLFIVGDYNKREVDKISEMYRLKINVKNYPLSTFEKALLRKSIFMKEILKNHIIILNAQEYILKLVRFYYGKD